MRSSTHPAVLAALLITAKSASGAPLDLGAIGSSLGSWFGSLPDRAENLFGAKHPILVFDSPAYQSPSDPNTWLASVRSYSYHDSAATDTLFDLFQTFLKPFGIDVEGDDAASEILQKRLDLFLTAGNDDETITLTFPDCDGGEAKNGPTGNTGMLDLPTTLGKCEGSTPALHVNGEDSGARAFLNAPTGWGIISDIDDTIKISHVLDPIKTTKKTLLEPLEPAPGMSELYRNIEDNLDDPAFLYLSGSPFQLYPMLHGFLESEKFPQGPIMLQNLSVADPAGLVKMVTADPLEYKLKSIDRIHEWYPERKWVAVGDSGQRDSEVYGEAYRKFGGEWMGCIWIREIEDEGANNTRARFEKAFEGVPSGKWRTFKDPKEMESVDLLKGEC